MLLHALILATLHLNLAELLVALCLASGNHTLSLEMTIASPFWAVGSWQGRSVRFRFAIVFLRFSLTKLTVSQETRKPCSKEMSGDFCGCDKKVLAASNPFSGNKSPWCWLFFGKKQGSGFLCHKKVKVTLYIPWHCFFLVRLQRVRTLNHENCVWGCCTLRITLAQACKSIKFVSLCQAQSA